ncbi:MAG: hypothetical protein DRI98_12100, partial [Bacteroidetes bacterium]
TASLAVSGHAIPIKLSLGAMAAKPSAARDAQEACCHLAGDAYSTRAERNRFDIRYGMSQNTFHGHSP